jgi:hypothetical protein
MAEKVILLTIQKIHAMDIFKRKDQKIVEYRSQPPKISKPTRTIMYVSKETEDGDSKKVREIIGEFMMSSVSGPPQRLANRKNNNFNYL